MSTTRSLLPNPTHLVALCLAVGLGAGLLLSASAPIQAPVDAGIRFVDIRRATTQYTFFKKNMVVIQNYINTEQAKLKALKTEFSKKSASLDDMKSDTKLARDTSVELVQLKAKIKLLQQMAELKMTKDQAQVENEAYRRIRKAIMAYVKAKGLKAVIKVSEIAPEDNGKMGLKETFQTNRLRSVLWHSPALDVTDDIVKMLNN